MKEILNEEDDPTDAAAKKKAERRKKTNCLDTIIDGSFMGIILVSFGYFLWTDGKIFGQN